MVADSAPEDSKITSTSGLAASILLRRLNPDDETPDFMR
jgi:hypothetical protein